MPSNALTAISRQRASRLSSEIAREYLVRFAEVCQREITRPLTTIWVDTLGGEDPNRLERACKQLMRTWTTNFLPTPGAIIALIDRADANGDDLTAEAEWQKLLDWVRQNYFPDIGIRRGAAQLDADTRHAARVAGGYGFIERCSESELVWCRKTFLAAYKNIRETRKSEHLLSDGDATKILEDIRRAAETLRPGAADRGAKLPAPVPEQTAGGITCEEVREVLNRIAAPSPHRECGPSDEEIRQRQESMRHALRVQEDYREANLDDWLAKHGLARPSDLVTALPVAGAKTTPKIEKHDALDDSANSDIPHPPYPSNQPNDLSAVEAIE